MPNSCILKKIARQANNKKDFDFQRTVPLKATHLKKKLKVIFCFLCVGMTVRRSGGSLRRPLSVILLAMWPSRIIFTCLTQCHKSGPVIMWAVLAFLCLIYTFFYLYKYNYATLKSSLFVNLLCIYLFFLVPLLEQNQDTDAQLCCSFSSLLDTGRHAGWLHVQRSHLVWPRRGFW